MLELGATIRADSQLTAEYELAIEGLVLDLILILSTIDTNELPRNFRARVAHERVNRSRSRHSFGSRDLFCAGHSLFRLSGEDNPCSNSLHCLSF